MKDIKITHGLHFVEGRVGGRLTAVRWRGDGAYYVAGPNDHPRSFPDDAAATRAFLVALGCEVKP